MTQGLNLGVNRLKVRSTLTESRVNYVSERVKSYSQIV